jgi:hypothetical protein
MPRGFIIRELPGQEFFDEARTDLVDNGWEWLENGSRVWWVCYEIDGVVLTWASIIEEEGEI